MIIPVGSMLFRMGAGVLLGGAIGYERERSGRPAGFRTHMLVSLASAVFMLVSTQFVYFQTYEKDELVSVDTSRIAASVVSGVGFLGAGAILRNGISVHGLTTAASLWLAAALGLAAGGGMYLIAFVATGLALFGLTILRRIERKRWQMIQPRVMLAVQGGSVSRTELASILKDLGLNVPEIDYERNTLKDESRFNFNVELSGEDALQQMVGRLEALPGIRRVKIQHTSG
jgi:putative Mg2+ transporter-C (MgtC) family protein